MCLQVYDFPPSVSKDVPDSQPIRDETYDVPPHFAKLKPPPPGRYAHGGHDDVIDDEPPIPEDVYDVPPPVLTDKRYRGDRTGAGRPPQDVYDTPASLRGGGPHDHDVYDFPREREDQGDRSVYDVPPQVLEGPETPIKEGDPHKGPETSIKGRRPLKGQRPP